MICLAPQLFLPVYLHANEGPPTPPAAALPQVFSAPSTGLDECFFLNSLVVRLLYSSISGRSGYFLFWDLLLSFFWLCEEARHIYLLHKYFKLISFIATYV